MSLTSVFADNGLAAVTQQPTCPINPVSYAVTDVLHHSEGTQATSSISFVASTLSDAFEQTLPAPVTTAIKGSWQAVSKWGRAIYNTLPSISIPVASAEAEDPNNTDFTELFRTTTDEECAESKNVPETARQLQDTPVIEVPITIKGTEQRINRIQLPLTAGDNPETLNVDASGLPEGGEFDAASVIRETFTPFEAGEILETALEVPNNGGWIASTEEISATKDYVYHLHSNFTLNRRAAFPTLLDNRVKLWATLNENTLVIVDQQRNNFNIYYWNSNNTFSSVSSHSWDSSTLGFETLLPKSSEEFDIVYEAESDHPSLVRNTPIVHNYYYNSTTQIAFQVNSNILIQDVPLDSNGNPPSYGPFVSSGNTYWIAERINGESFVNKVERFGSIYNQTDEFVISGDTTLLSVSDNTNTAYIQDGDSSDPKFARYDLSSKEQTHLLTGRVASIGFNDQQQEIFVNLGGEHLSLNSETLGEKANFGLSPSFQFFNNNQLTSFIFNGNIHHYSLHPNYALGETGSLIITPQLAYQVAAELDSERTVSVAYTTESGSGDVEFRLQYQLGSASVDPACTQEFSGNVDDGFSFILNGRCIQDSDFRAWNVNIPLPAGVDLTAAEPSFQATEYPTASTRSPFISDGTRLLNFRDAIDLVTGEVFTGTPDAWVAGYNKATDLSMGEQFLSSGAGGFDIYLKIFNFTGDPVAPYQQVYSVGPYDTHTRVGSGIVPAQFDDTFCILGIREADLVDPNTWSCFNTTNPMNITHLSTIKDPGFNPSMNYIVEIKSATTSHILNNLGLLVPVTSNTTYLEAFASDAMFTSSSLAADHLTVSNDGTLTLASKTDGLHIYSNLGVSASSPEPQEIAFFATDSDCIISGINEAGDILAIAEKNGIVHIMNIQQAAEGFAVLHLLHEVAIGFTLTEPTESGIIFRHDHNDQIVIYRSEPPERSARIIPSNGDWLNIGKVSVTVDQLGTNSKNLILKDDAGREIELPITISGQPIAPTLTDFAHALLDENGQITIEAPEWTGLTFNSGQNIPDTYVKLTDYLTLQNGGVETYFVSSPSAIRPFDAREPSIVDIVDTDGSSDTFLKIPSFVPSSASFNTDTSGSAIEGISQTFSFQLGSSFSPNALTLNIPITIQARSVEPLLSFSLTTETGTQTLTGLPTLNNPGSISDEDGLLFTYLQVDGPASNLTQTGAATETARYFGSRVLGTQLETLPPQNTIGTHSIYALIRRFHPVTKTSLDPQVPWFIANITNRGLGFSNPGRLLDSSVSLFVGVPLDITFNGPETVCSLSADGSYSAQFILSAPASATGYTVTQYSGEARARISASSPNTVIINGRCLLPEPYPDAGQIDRRVDVETTLNPLSSLDAVLITQNPVEGSTSEMQIEVSTPGEFVSVELTFNEVPTGFSLSTTIEDRYLNLDATSDTLHLNQVPVNETLRIHAHESGIHTYQLPLTTIFPDSTQNRYTYQLTVQDFSADQQSLNEARVDTSGFDIIQVKSNVTINFGLLPSTASSVEVGTEIPIELHGVGSDPNTNNNDPQWIVGSTHLPAIEHAPDGRLFNQFKLSSDTQLTVEYALCVKNDAIVFSDDAGNPTAVIALDAVKRLNGSSLICADQRTTRFTPAFVPEDDLSLLERLSISGSALTVFGAAILVGLIFWSHKRQKHKSQAIIQGIRNSLRTLLAIAATQDQFRTQIPADPIKHHTPMRARIQGMHSHSSAQGAGLSHRAHSLNWRAPFNRVLINEGKHIDIPTTHAAFVYHITHLTDIISNGYADEIQNGEAFYQTMMACKYGLALWISHTHSTQDLAKDPIDLVKLPLKLIKNMAIKEAGNDQIVVNRFLCAFMLSGLLASTRKGDAQYIHYEHRTRILSQIDYYAGRIHSAENLTLMPLMKSTRALFQTIPTDENVFHYVLRNIKTFIQTCKNFWLGEKHVGSIPGSLNFITLFGALTMITTHPNTAIGIASDVFRRQNDWREMAISILILNLIATLSTIPTDEHPTDAYESARNQAIEQLDRFLLQERTKPEGRRIHQVCFGSIHYRDPRLERLLEQSLSHIAGQMTPSTSSHSGTCIDYTPVREILNKYTPQCHALLSLSTRATAQAALPKEATYRAPELRAERMRAASQRQFMPFYETATCGAGGPIHDAQFSGVNPVFRRPEFKRDEDSHTP